MSDVNSVSRSRWLKNTGSPSSSSRDNSNSRGSPGRVTPLRTYPRMSPGSQVPYDVVVTKVMVMNNIPNPRPSRGLLRMCQT